MMFGTKVRNKGHHQIVALPISQRRLRRVLRSRIVSTGELRDGNARQAAPPVRSCPVYAAVDLGKKDPVVARWLSVNTVRCSGNWMIQLT